MTIKLTSLSLLFLQGPISPFFNTLAHQFKKHNCNSIHKIQLCYSDKFWWDFNLHPYKGNINAFDIFINNIIQNQKITDVFLLGDCRPYHIKTINQAKNHGCNIWIFEEGYIRPNVITLEYNSGANGYSNVPNNKEFFYNYKLLNTNKIINIKNSLFSRFMWDFIYHINNFIFKKQFKNYIHHRPAKIWQEYLGITKRYIKKIIFYNKFILLIKFNNIKNKKYFFIPLQLSHDFQIIKHSKYSSTLDMIDEIIDNFDKYASKNTYLIFKLHPLDTLIINCVKHISQNIKKKPYLKKRIIIFDGGVLYDLIQYSQGVIIINSTVGMQSLIQGKPTKALGKAIYNFDGLTDQQTWVEFFKNPQKPDKKLVNRFKQYIVDNKQINGSFYSKDGISIASLLIINKILTNKYN